MQTNWDRVVIATVGLPPGFTTAGNALMVTTTTQSRDASGTTRRMSARGSNQAVASCSPIAIAAPPSAYGLAATRLGRSTASALRAFAR